MNLTFFQSDGSQLVVPTDDIRAIEHIRHAMATTKFGIDPPAGRPEYQVSVAGRTEPLSTKGMSDRDHHVIDDWHTDDFEGRERREVR